MPNGKIPEKAKELIDCIGDWYMRMDGALEAHTVSPFAIELTKDIPFVVTWKNGKNYLHFYKGVPSSAIAFDVAPEFPPKRVRLLNDGRELRVRFDLLPGIVQRHGRASGPYVSIADIPCNEFTDEPMVIEIEW